MFWGLSQKPRAWQQQQENTSFEQEETLKHDQAHITLLMAGQVKEEKDG